MVSAEPEKKISQYRMGRQLYGSACTYCMDERFRAFDKESGKVLWEYLLDAGG